jgi:ribosomal protein S18 acetylase RimI-like enzyme
MKAVIHEAEKADLLFVKTLMNEALAPYYGGDHLADADRIFNTHISGGRDALGFFSTEQKMFVATVNEQPIGMIHLVGKRQGTYKISPLIVAPTYQSRHGIGAQLLQFAEEYARERQATQLYCTVAKENESALRFFIRHGFVLAGNSPSHYKDGITEVMVYKPLWREEDEKKLDAPNISVSLAEKVHYDAVRKVLLDVLPRYFRDIDNNWVDSLFRGYERRHTGDINQKFKLLYVATDRSGSVLGVAGATPKKGEPIKVMLFIGIEPAAFIGLLVEIPHLLKQYGRKLYVHIVPTAEQTIVLQQHGWKLGAALPAAYHREQVTQQWSLDLDEKFTMRTMRVKQRYLDLIAENRRLWKSVLAMQASRQFGKTSGFA